MTGSSGKKIKKEEAMKGGEERRRKYTVALSLRR